jgi:hypothetical protein
VWRGHHCSAGPSAGGAVAGAASTAILGAWVGSANAARHWIAAVLGACAGALTLSQAAHAVLLASLAGHSIDIVHSPPPRPRNPLALVTG